MQSLTRFLLPRVLVERSQEITLFRSCLAEAATGVGSLLILSGETGVGKTLLAAQMVQEARHQNLSVLIGRGDDVMVNIPYGLWLAAFGVPDEVPNPAHSPMLTFETSSNVFTVFQQVWALLQEQTATHPLVLLLEDLQDADIASLELLRLVVRSVATIPVVLLVTYRAEILAQISPASIAVERVSREPRASRLSVHPFTRAEVDAFIQTRYALPPTEHRRLIAYLQKYAAGNALYLDELLRMLEEQSLLHQEQKRWLLENLTRVRVPPLLRQIIEQRLLRLEPEEQQLLRLASIIGQIVQLDLWQEASLVAREVLLQLIEKGVVHALLDVLPEGHCIQFHHPLIRQVLLETVIPPRRRVWHQQLAELLATRAEPHADLIAFHFHEARDPRAILWLQQAAEQTSKLGSALTVADLYAMMLHEAYAAHVTKRERARLQISLGWMRRVADPRSSLAPVNQALQLAREIGDQELMILALGCLAHLRCSLKEIRAGLANVREAQALWMACTPEARASWTLALPNPPVVIRTFDIFGVMIYLLAQCGYAQEARTLAEPLVVGLPNFVGTSILQQEKTFFYGMLYSSLALIYSTLGMLEKARYAFAQANALYTSLTLYLSLGVGMQQELAWLTFPYQPDQVSERVRLAESANQMFLQGTGLLSEQRQDFAHLPLWYLEGCWKEAYQLAESLATMGGAEVVGKGITTCFAGWLFFHQGKPALTWPLIDNVLPAGLASEPGEACFFEALTMQWLAILLHCEEKNLEQAHQWLEMHDRWLIWSGSIYGQAMGKLLWAIYYGHTQNQPMARSCAEQALHLATAVRQPLVQVETHRFLGSIALADDRKQEARQHLTAALTLAESCAVPYERALTLREFAELEAAEHHFAQARTMLHEALAICKDLDAAPALARCEALALGLFEKEETATPTARLTEKQAEPQTKPVLTMREREIVRLVAEGWSNQQIARQLSLSAGTVKRHLFNVSKKLDARSRTQAVTIARQLDLLI